MIESEAGNGSPSSIAAAASLESAGASFWSLLRSSESGSCCCGVGRRGWALRVVSWGMKAAAFGAARAGAGSALRQASATAATEIDARIDSGSVGDRLDTRIGESPAIHDGNQENRNLI